MRKVNDTASSKSWNKHAIGVSYYFDHTEYYYT